MWVKSKKKCFYVESRVAQYFSLLKKNKTKQPTINLNTRIKKKKILFVFFYNIVCFAAVRR